MRLLVTGGSGFIGSNLIRFLLREHPSYSVTNIDALTYAGNPENLRDLEGDPRYRFVHGDICDAQLVGDLMRETDAIIHCAAETHVDRSIADAHPFIRTNVEGTLTLLEAARERGTRFHHISTDEVFGSLGPDDAPFTELTPYDPRSPYAASKAASDHLVRSYGHTYGLPVTISNCSNNYGPYQFPEKLIPFFISRLIDGQTVPVYGDGKNIRDWIHVDDHARGVDAVLHRGRIGETYCLGGGAERTNLAITAQLLKQFGVGDDRVTHVEDRKGHDRRYAIDYTKAERELGWRPTTAFADGLAATVAWYRSHESWWRPLITKTA